MWEDLRQAWTLWTSHWTQQDTYLLGAIVLLALSSFITRTVYFILGDYVPLNESTRRALRYAPGAALTAIIIPSLFPLSGDGTMTVAVDQLLAAAAAILVFLRTRNTLLVIAVGMVVFWCVRFLFSLAAGGVGIDVASG